MLFQLELKAPFALVSKPHGSGEGEPHPDSICGRQLRLDALEKSLLNDASLEFSSLNTGDVHRLLRIYSERYYLGLRRYHGGISDISLKAAINDRCVVEEIFAEKGELLDWLRMNVVVYHRGSYKVGPPGRAHERSRLYFQESKKRYFPTSGRAIELRNFVDPERAF